MSMLTRSSLAASGRQAPQARRPCAKSITPNRRGTQHCLWRVRATQLASHDNITDIDAQKIADMQRRFRMADTDGNGRIDRTELAHLLQSTDSGNAVTFTEHWLLDEDLQEALRKYDVDNSGDLDLEEFTQLVYDGLLLDGKLSEYEEAFKRVDTSGNGSIGFMELSSLLTALGSPLSHEKLVDLFKQYDIDESGQIEFGEFLRMCRDQLLDLQKILSFMNDRPLPLEEQRMLVPAEGEISVILSEHELDEVLQRQQQQHRNDLVVVFCGFTWCRPCKAMAGPAGKLAQLYKKGTTWLKVYGNANSQTKNMCQHRLLIRSTPCFLLFKNGELVDTITGSNKQKLEGRIIHHLPEKYLPADGPLYYRPPAEAAASDVAMPAPA